MVSPPVRCCCVQRAYENPNEIRYVMPDGETKVISPPMTSQRVPTAWLWRNDLLQFLYEQVQELYPNAIDVHFNAKCTSLQKHTAPGTPSSRAHAMVSNRY